MSALALVHGLDYLASASLIGALFFDRWILGEPKRSHDLGRAAGVAAFFCGVRMVATAADMAESWAPGSIWIALSHTQFGILSTFRLGAISAAGIFLIARQPGFALLACASLPALFALAGHAGASEGGASLNLVLDSAHFAAVALWSGGLIRLWQWLREAHPEGRAFGAVSRFSRLAMASTLILALAGIWLAWCYGVRPGKVFGGAGLGDYERVLLAKLGLFTVALAIASLHPFVHLRRWRIGRDAELVRGVRYTLAIELAVVAAIFLAAGVLTRQAPPADGIEAQSRR